MVTSLHKLAAILIFFSLLQPQVLVAQVMTSSNYQLRFDSANAGGGLSTSSSYQLEDTAGEVATGKSGSAPSNWFNTSWEHRVKVTINSSEVTSTLSDFPLYVDLAHLPSDFFMHVASDGADIRVTEADGTTETPFEVVSVDTNASTGELHVKIDSLSSSSDTDLFVYYGNATASAYAATSTYGRNNVWTEYEAVYHFEETPDGTSGDVVDSTGNGNDGTSNGSMSASNVVSGIIGNAYDFNSVSSQYIQLAGGPLNGATALTASYWIEDPSYDDGRVLSNGAVGGGTNQVLLWPDNDNGFDAIVDSSRTNGGAVENYVGWHHHALIYDGSNLYNIEDGVIDGSASKAGTTSSGTNYVGRDNVAANYLSDVVDEVRIARQDLGTEWLLMEIFNYKYPRILYTVHEEEDQYGTYVLNAGYQQMNETFVSMSVINDVLLKPGVGVTANNSVGSETIKVRSDSPAGYNLYVKTTQSPALQHQNGGSDFSDYTPVTPSTPEVWAVDSGQSQFGFSLYDEAGGDVADGTWGDADDCGSTTTGDPDTAGGNEQLYDGLSTSDRLIAQRSDRTSEIGSDIVFCFAAGTNDGLVEFGDYQAPIVVTAIAL